MTPLHMMSTDIGKDEPEDEPLPTERSLSFLRRRKAKALKRLENNLGLIDSTDDFMRMVWHIDKIGEGNRAGFGWFTRAEKEVLKWAREPHHVHKWTLESLVLAYLRAKPLRRRGDRAFRMLDTRNLVTPIQLIHQINELENADDGLALRRLDVVGELHRIAQRQFHWQRGKMHKAAFLKSAYLFTFPEADEHFQSRHGVSIHDFCLAGFAIAAMLQKHSACMSKPRVQDIAISAETLAKCMSLYAVPETKLRAEAAKMQQVTTHSAYQASVLRKWPCVLLPEKGLILAPVPDLVIERFTNGLYYDLVGEDGRLRDMIGKQFESYCRLLLSEFLPEVSTVPEFKYGPKGRMIDSPDAFLVKDRTTLGVVECKAKKAPITIKLGEEPDTLNASELDELAKGAFQIWRFFSHVRRGIVAPPGGSLAKDAVALVILMDSWMETSTAQREEVLARARRVCEAKDPLITAEDQRPIAFANVDELEHVLQISTGENLLRTLREVAKPERAGWLLSSTHDDIAPGEQLDKPDPMEKYLEQYIKWWDPTVSTSAAHPTAS